MESTIPLFETQRKDYYDCEMEEEEGVTVTTKFAVK